MHIYECQFSQRAMLEWQRLCEIQELAGLSLNCLPRKPCAYLATTRADMLKHIWDVHLRSRGQPAWRHVRLHMGPGAARQLGNLVQGFAEEFALQRCSGDWSVAPVLSAGQWSVELEPTLNLL